MSSKDRNTEPLVKGCFIPSFTEQIVTEKLICDRHCSIYLRNINVLDPEHNRIGSSTIPVTYRWKLKHRQEV